MRNTITKSQSLSNTKDNIKHTSETTPDATNRWDERENTSN